MSHDASFHLDLNLPARLPLAGTVRDFFMATLKTQQVDERTAFNVGAATYEALVNVMKHAYDKQADRTVRVVLSLEGDRVTVTLEDSGAAMEVARITGAFEDNTDAFTQPDPDVSGTSMMMTLMDSVDYDRRGDRNVLTLTKRLPPR